MSNRQTWTCKKCQQENAQDATSCTQCGTAFTPFDRRGFIIALGLTAVPFIITPILIALDTSEDMYFEGLLYLLANAVLMAVYVAAGGIVSLVIWLSRTHRSVAIGVLVGLGVGTILGMASCGATLATISLE